MTKRTLLAVLAHPDDESFGIGGTLARYVCEGVDVHVAIATDGVAGSVIKGFESKLDQLVPVRMAELEAAAEILGVTLHRFCYRDSGYLGDPANNHPDAFINVDEEEAVGRVVALIRAIRPQVIITHDEDGGYFHPDHIFCCKIATAAFHAAGDADKFSETGLAPCQPQRLYYTTFPKKWAKFFTRLMRMFGQDPTSFGRNKDIDLTRMGDSSDRIHVTIDIRAYWEIKQEASSQHVSQGGSGGPIRGIPTWLLKRLLGREMFTRAFPPVGDRFREEDLFAELENG